jgi:hypothetical protein
MTLKKNLKLCLLAVAVVVAYPATALAQGSPPDAVTTPLWVSLVAILVGYCVHAHQTGELFGQKTLPKAWLPYAGILATFGTAFLAALPSGGTISKSALEVAALAGLQAFVPMAIGVAGHVAQTAHKSSRGVAAMGGNGSTSTTVPPASPPANDIAKSVPPAAALLAMVLAIHQMACISSAPIVPETSANQSQIQTCQSTAELHNGVVISGFVLTGSTAGLAGVAAAEPDSNATVKTALSVAGAIVGGIAIADAAVAAFTNSNFQNSQCSNVVGPLPTTLSPTTPSPSAPSTR